MSFIGIQILAKKSSQENTRENSSANRIDSEQNQNEKVDRIREACHMVFKIENLDEMTLELLKQLYDALVLEDKAKLGLDSNNHL